MHVAPKVYSINRWTYHTHPNPCPICQSTSGNWGRSGPLWIRISTAIPNNEIAARDPNPNG